MGLCPPRCELLGSGAAPASLREQPGLSSAVVSQAPGQTDPESIQETYGLLTDLLSHGSTRRPGLVL